MQELTGGQKARNAVREFKAITDALSIKGEYRLQGNSGQSLKRCLLELSPEIYGTINDPRVVELDGMIYVIDRLPKGIEECTRLILTEEDASEKGRFERTDAVKRRRTCYRIGEKEMCFVISRGLSEVYDIVTHMTFLYVEAKKIHMKMKNVSGETSSEWRDLTHAVERMEDFKAGDMDQALWNLSIVLGRSYQETREAHDRLEESRGLHDGNNGLFSLVFNLGERIEAEKHSRDDALTIYLTPSLMNIIGQQIYEKKWARNIHEKIQKLGLEARPVHIVSANLHSIRNTLYAYGALAEPDSSEPPDFFAFINQVRDRNEEISAYAESHGFHEIKDLSGCHVDCQLIDTTGLEKVDFHSDLRLKKFPNKRSAPVILVLDYAFGAQAFELMENLLKPPKLDGKRTRFSFSSISIMGKAGILSGKKGDIMLPSAHVFEGSSDNYRFENDLEKADFEAADLIYSGPMATVLGTSLQNRHMLKEFQADWKIIGLEMEGGHYQRAIGAAMIKGNIPKDLKVRYAYYASDNPLETGSTLAAGPMAEEGVKPTYEITRAILSRILEKGELD